MSREMDNPDEHDYDYEDLGEDNLTNRRKNDQQEILEAVQTPSNDVDDTNSDTQHEDNRGIWEFGIVKVIENPYYAWDTTFIFVINR